MSALLEFFANLILFTAGLGVAFLWLFILVAICIEMYDFFKGDNEHDPLDEYEERS